MQRSVTSTLLQTANVMFYHTMSRASPLACRWFLARWTTVNRSAYYGHVVDTPSQLRERKIHRR